MENIFQGKLVRLRAVELVDWEGAYLSNRDSTEGGRTTDEIWFPMSQEQAHAWAEEQAKNGAHEGAFRFMIDRLDGVTVGNISTHGINRRVGSFMYGLGAPQFRRGGFASEAIRLVLRYYFWERRYRKVTAEVYSFNTPSIWLHERLDFTSEGSLRRMVYTGGEFYDALFYVMTREEFEVVRVEGLAEGRV